MPRTRSSNFHSNRSANTKKNGRITDTEIRGHDNTFSMYTKLSSLTAAKRNSLLAGKKCSLKWPPPVAVYNLRTRKHVLCFSNTLTTTSQWKSGYWQQHLRSNQPHSEWIIFRMEHDLPVKCTSQYVFPNIEVNPLTNAAYCSICIFMFHCSVSFVQEELSISKGSWNLNLEDL